MIKMLTGIAGNDFAFQAGDEVDVFTKKEEENYIKAGIAERVTKKQPRKAKPAKK